MTKLSETQIAYLIQLAIDASKNSYSPYSEYRVGAALMVSQEHIFTGSNIENASFGATNCAERTAVFKAVSEGFKDFQAIAIYGENSLGKADFAYPCGICRQVLAEFCSKDLPIIIAKSKNNYKEFTLGELLPESFSLDNF